jgi:PAS domain S-box-containing protein
MLFMDNKTQWILSAVASLVLLICLISFYQLQQQQVDNRRIVLQHKLDASERLFTQWFQQHKSKLNIWAHYPDVIQASETLSSVSSAREALAAHPVQVTLRRFFSPLLKTTQIDNYMLVDSRGQIRASSDSRLIGQLSPIAEYPALFAPLWEGQNQWLLPYPSAYTVSDENGVYRKAQSMLLMATPISHKGDIKGALIFTVNMRRELHHLLGNVISSPNELLQVTSKSIPLVQLGASAINTDFFGTLAVEKKHRQLPVHMTFGQVFPISEALATQQYILLSVGSLSLLALVGLMIFRLRGKSQKTKPSAQPRLIFEREGEGLIQFSESGQVINFNIQAGRLIAGNHEVTTDVLHRLITECALGLHGDSGKPFGDLNLLLNGNNDQVLYAWWSGAGIKRLLAFNRESSLYDTKVVVSVKDVTQSRQDFLRLQRQSKALNDTTELVLWVSQEGGISGGNDTALDVLGYSEQELQSMAISDIDTTINEESWILIWRRVRRGEVISHEANILRRSGSTFPAETQMHFYADGFQTFVCLFIRDTSKRKRLEADVHRHRMRLAEKLSVTSQELEVREAENDALIESLPDLLIVFNSRFEVLNYQQPKGEPLSFKVFNGQSLFSLFPVLSIPVLTSLLVEPVYTELARYFTEITRENGSQLQILELRFARTGTHKILLLVRDITERKREEYFRQFNNRLLVSISDMQTRFICNRDKRPDVASQLKALVHLAQAEKGYYWLSTPLQQKLGCTATGVFQPSSFFISESDDQAIQERIYQTTTYWEASIEPPRPILISFKDIVFDKKQPETAHQGLLTLPIVSGDSTVMCYSLILDDYRHWASETGLFEPWLATCAALLAGYESENERLWAEENVKLEKERAESASQAKTQFLSRMSHEFRTPLNAILGFGQLLQLEDGLLEEHAEHVNQIVASGESMLALVDDVLDLAQLERQEFSVSLVCLSLTDIFTACVSDIIDAIEQADLKFETDLPNEDYYIQADERRLKQVIMSLLNNAIRYTPAGGTISVKHLCRGDYCELSVKDTGKGISKDFIKKIFVPFEAAEGYINAQGMGNGLAVARHVIEAMGGHIEVESELGLGSCFTLKLPCHLNAAQACLPEHHNSDTDRISARSNDGALDEQESSDSDISLKGSLREQAADALHSEHFRVLYIEDDDTNRKVLSKLLHYLDSDIDFLGAESAEDGIALYLESAPDLLFVDMNLGAISGSDVLKTIRGYPEGRELPIIAVSGDVGVELIDQALDLGFDDYLCKPISLELLTSVVMRYRS